MGKKIQLNANWLFLGFIGCDILIYQINGQKFCFFFRSKAFRPVPLHRMKRQYSVKLPLQACETATIPERLKIAKCKMETAEHCHYSIKALQYEKLPRPQHIIEGNQQFSSASGSVLEPAVAEFLGQLQQFDAF